MPTQKVAGNWETRSPGGNITHSSPTTKRLIDQCTSFNIWKSSESFEFHLPPLPLADAAKKDSDGEDGADDAEDD